MTDDAPLHLFVPTYDVEACLAGIRECLERGWTGLGYKTVEFEEAWRAYTGLPHAHFLSSATAGLHLAVRLLKERRGWRDGDEVVTTPLTFVSTNHVLLHERLRPVFADVDEHLCLDPTSVESRIGPRTRAVMFVGLGGNSGRLDEVAGLCKAKGLALVLDAAHMAGTRLHGRHVGAEADAAVFSFHSVKNLPTADGGMLCLRDAGLDAEARKWSWLGISKDTYARTGGPAGTYKWMYDVEREGFKCHGNSVMAAIGLAQIGRLDRDNAYRRQLAEWYGRDLCEVRRHGDRNVVAFVPQGVGCESSRHLYQVRCDRRDELMVFLNAASIYPGVHYRDNTEYPMYAHGRGTCPRAREASGDVVSLPLHLRMGRSDVARVAGRIREFLDKKRVDI